MEQFLKKYGSNIFFGYIIIGIIPIFVFVTEFNTPFYYSFKYLSLPILTLTFYVYLMKMPTYRRANGDVKGILLTMLYTVMFILFCSGYIIGFNAIFGKQTDYKIEGTIVSLSSISGGKGGAKYHVSIKNSMSDNVIKLDVSKHEYDKLNIGQVYSAYWKVGSLGIIYKRK